MRVLAGILLTLALAAPASALTVVAEPIGTNDEGTRFRVSPAAPRTLSPGSGSVELGGCGLPQADVSPSGRRVAVPDCDALRILDRRAWAFKRSVKLPGPVLAAFWTTDRRVLALTDNGPEAQSAVYVIDAARGRVLARRGLDHTPKETVRVGRHWAVVDSDYRFFSVPLEEREDSVLRLFDARGRQRVVPLGMRILAPEQRNLKAYRGRLYVALGERILVVDPETGRRRTLDVSDRTIVSLLAIDGRRITAIGTAIAEPPRLQILGRRTGREITSRTLTYQPIGLGSSWVAARRDGIAGYTVAGRRVWSALPGVDTQFDGLVTPIGRHLYVVRRADRWLLAARTGRILDRATSPDPGSVADWDTNGRLDFNYVGDGGDDLDD